MTADEINRAYVYDKNGRDRQRVKRCWYDRAILTERAGFIYCPQCGRTADEMAQVSS
jgi:hypothetical protein